MKKLFSFFLIAFFCLKSWAYQENYEWVDPREYKDGIIVALAELQIDGVKYDVSFDGAFGTSDLSVFGLDDFTAGGYITAAFNQYPGDPRNKDRWPFPRVANSSQIKFQIRTNNPQAATAFYSAGWVCCTFEDTNPADFVYFALHVPGVVIDTPINPIPEPSTYMLLIAGVMVVGGALYRRMAGKFEAMWTW